MADRERERDAVDAHVARWVTELPGMDPQVEGAITRMQHLLRRLQRANAAAFAESDITEEDYKTLHTLMVLAYPAEATPAQLAEACHVTRAAMTSRLDRLADGGYVTRTMDPTDRRRVLVRPTRRGREVWEAAVVEGMAREQHLLHALDDRELRQLNALLRRVMLSHEE
jgi:DNA-binding MarR family transcriptional regulator